MGVYAMSTPQRRKPINRVFAICHLSETSIKMANKEKFLSLMGKTGGEIFHEMMLRHNVKHICVSPLLSPNLAKLSLTPY